MLLSTVAFMAHLSDDTLCNVYNAASEERYQAQRYWKRGLISESEYDQKWGDLNELMILVSNIIIYRN